jgi:hypothetical protein
MALEISGCQLAPREQLDECHRLSQTLRSENAQLKDQMLALRSQNQDYSERAVDDARRLSQLEAVNDRLEASVQAYQDERTRLESAYKELRASLPGAQSPLIKNSMDTKTNQPLDKRTSSFGGPVDRDVKKASGTADATQTRAVQKPKAKRARTSWAPSLPAGGDDDSTTTIRIGP